MNSIKRGAVLASAALAVVLSFLFSNVGPANAEQMGTQGSPIQQVRNEDTRWEVFWLEPRTDDPSVGELWHQWEYTRGGPVDWSPRQSLGGRWTLANGIDVGKNADGRLEVFMRAASTGELQHMWQFEPNGGGWSVPQVLGAGMTMAVGSPSGPCVDYLDFGDNLKIRIWLRSTNGNWYYLRQQSPNGNWTGVIRSQTPPPVDCW